MKVLAVHNRYQQPGGEDRVFDSETDLLRSRGHEVLTFVKDNDSIRGAGRWAVARGAVFSRSCAEELAALMRENPGIDVAHFHNTFPLISSSGYLACRSAGVSVVQTLHNYRPICPKGTLRRSGSPCESCVGRSVALPAVLHRCYRGSWPGSLVAAGNSWMQLQMAAKRNWIDLYIAPTEFVKKKFVEGGFPESKIVVQPHGVFPDPGAGNTAREFALFAGFLVEDKGPAVLLEAWRRLSGVPLKIAGDGPLLQSCRAMAEAIAAPIEFLGHCDQEKLLRLMRAAKFLVVPSLFFETMGMVVLEAFACATPVIASDLGALAEVIEDARTGLLFKAGDAAALSEKVRWALRHEEALARMGRACRLEYERRYNADAHYAGLSSIYGRVLEKNRRDLD